MYKSRDQTSYIHCSPRVCDLISREVFLTALNFSRVLQEGKRKIENNEMVETVW